VSYRAFTILELLIVVAIISILAAIAVPNMLEAQSRAKASAARAQLRTIAGALAAYFADHNGLPPTEPLFPGDPLALLADHQLAVLTTPIAYLGTESFRDPFGTPELYSITAGSSTSFLAPNASASSLYYHYESTRQRLGSTDVFREDFGLVSIGPDQEDSLGGFCHLAPARFQQIFPYVGPEFHPLDSLYDPTNGSATPGDVVRLGSR